VYYLKTLNMKFFEINLFMIKYLKYNYLSMLIVWVKACIRDAKNNQTYLIHLCWMNIYPSCTINYDV
jgi:hypothetical protein